MSLEKENGWSKYKEYARKKKKKKAIAMLLMFQNNHTFSLDSRDLHRHNYVPGKGELRNIIY